MKRRYRIETVTFVDGETTGKWPDADVLEALRVRPCVDGTLFHYDGTRDGSLRTTGAALTESSYTRVRR